MGKSTKLENLKAWPLQLTKHLTFPRPNLGLVWFGLLCFGCLLLLCFWFFVTSLTIPGHSLKTLK
jgi:hypothetical protein